MLKPDNTTSLKELDESLAVNKGTSFRLFKGVLTHLEQGQDFLYLDANKVDDAVIIQQLKASKRIYGSSTHAVLLSDTLVTKLKGLYSVVKDQL